MSDVKWDTRFMNLARHVAQWSKDPSTKCGAVIVNRRRVVSLGFNGFAAGTSDEAELYLDREYKNATVIHCEENAIIQAQTSVRGYTMYLTGMSCGRCTARVIQAGIDRVVVPYKAEDAFSHRGESKVGWMWDKQFEYARRQLEEAQVELFVLEPTGYDPLELMGPEHPGYGWSS
jgi:dCMP deaminase